jgi:hypothetical protein
MKKTTLVMGAADGVVGDRSTSGFDRSCDGLGRDRIDGQIEVSVAIAASFGTYAQDYRELSSQGRFMPSLCRFSWSLGGYGC